MDNMKFTEETFGSIVVFHLQCKLMGGPEMQAMCDRLQELIRTGTKSMVMDFQNVRWINSSGIGKIIGCLTTLRNNDGDVRFANLQGVSRHYFHITKLESIIKAFDRVDEVVESFQMT